MRFNGMVITTPKNVLMSLWMMEVWNPDKVRWIHSNPKKSRAACLYYKTRGVVLADRVLNSEYVEEK